MSPEATTLRYPIHGVQSFTAVANIFIYYIRKGRVQNHARCFLQSGLADEAEEVHDWTKY